jgi:hypothetical protein
MFAGSINVEEAILEFVNGKAARSTISFYNRGDSGDIEVTEFDRIFKAIGQNLGQVHEGRPKTRKLMSTNAALPCRRLDVDKFANRRPRLLEYNEYKVPGKPGKPGIPALEAGCAGSGQLCHGKNGRGSAEHGTGEACQQEAGWGCGHFWCPHGGSGPEGLLRGRELPASVRVHAHPLRSARNGALVSVDAESGANVFAMQKSLAKIDEHFKVSFKALINPENYYTSARKRRVSEKQFVSIVKEYAEKGIPLLWALELGRVPEIPPLPGAGQTRGGHMRMIIGYNLEKNQILFTDSWGAGHELKRMATLDAYDVTIGLYSMAPRGL